MRVLFDGEIRVHYRFLHVHPEYDIGMAMGDASAGQANGLLGARRPGALAMVTGLHTGDVPVRIEWHDEEPSPSPEWEEVVEASFTPGDDEYLLAAFDDTRELGALPRTPLRARWHASGMDAANEADLRMDGEPAVDRYLLQLWPAPTAPDAVIQVTSEMAADRHREASETPIPPPPPPPTEAELETLSEEAIRLANIRRGRLLRGDG